MFNGKFQLGTDITVHPRAYTSPKQTRQADGQTDKQTRTRTRKR